MLIKIIKMLDTGLVAYMPSLLTFLTLNDTVMKVRQIKLLNALLTENAGHIQLNRHALLYN